MTAKQPWTVPGVPWKTESGFWVWVRGILRKGWSGHPVKIEYINLHRKRIKNPNVKTAKRFPEVWGMKCEICNVDHLQSNIEIDHVGDSATFTGLSDTESYVQHLYLVDFESLRALCKPCHSVVSHAQNKGIAFEEAVIEKKVIEVEKTQKPDKIIAMLKARGYDDVSNKDKRRVALTEMFTKEKIDG